MKKAVILSAGEGRRMRPLTDALPKVMLPVADRPILEHLITRFSAQGIGEFYINLHYLPEVITAHFCDGRRLGVHIEYAHEPTLRGTAGALNGFRGHLDETFLVHYGDVFTELNLARMLEFHRTKGAAASLVVHPTKRPHDSDVIVLNGESRVTAVHHRPGDMRFGNIGNAASYILEPSVLAFLPQAPGQYDFVQDVFPLMLAQGAPIFGYQTSEFIQDMGTFERYEKLKARLESTQ